ncbi:MAG: quinone-dependent dihydroorotate dehydrogenase, partial [Succinatimonas sp.]|nr:quinone-dependent dihydroorotate dehydrogenase [Succinatimonas sp.]
MIPYFLYPNLRRPLLFTADAESAPHFIMKNGHALSKEPITKIFAQNVQDCPVEIMGLKFKN